MEGNTSFYNMLKKNAALMPDGAAVLYDTFLVTYKKLFEDAWKKALHLQRFPGKRIAIYGPASYRWIVNMFGTILAGKDVVLVDFFLPQDIRSELLKKTEVNYILSSTNQYILADEHAIIINHADKDDVTGLVYDESTKEGDIIMFTATADESDKAVALTAENIFHTVDAVSRCCQCGPSDRVLAQIALHHIFGYIYSLIWPLSNGACVCVGRGLRHIDADTYYYHPTILPGTPSMIDYFRRVKAFNEELKIVVTDGTGYSDKMIEFFNDRGIEVYHIYGMTETTGCIGISRMKGDKYQLFDKDAVALSDTGEILVRGDCVMKGYDHDAQASAKVIQDGFFYTGDHGRMGSDGQLEIAWRNQDVLILPTGERISRNVINEEINALNGVAESYTGIFDNKLVTFVVPVDREASADKFKRVIARYNEKKGYRWQIQQVEVRNMPLPKGQDGRVDEKNLESMMAEG